LSSRPERSVVERSAVSTVLPWECFSTERSGVERPAVSAVPSLEMFFDRAYPDFLLRVASDVHVCGSPQREPHADHQRHGSPQEIRASVVEKSAVCPPGLRTTYPYREFILSRNSALLRVLPNRSTSNSIASTGDNGLSTLRRTQIRCRSSFGISNSSLRVPER
jgi:hypothetical protein